MSIDNIIKYIEARNKRRGPALDDYAGYVCDAISSHMTNSSARTLMTYLLTGDDESLALMIQCFLEAEYGEKAEQFAIDNAPLSPAEQRFYDAKPAGVSMDSWESGVPDRGEI